MPPIINRFRAVVMPRVVMGAGANPWNSKKLTCLSVPHRLTLRKSRWQVEDTTSCLAGGDLGDRATKQVPVPSLGNCQEPNTGRECYRQTGDG